MTKKRRGKKEPKAKLDQSLYKELVFSFKYSTELKRATAEFISSHHLRPQRTRADPESQTHPQKRLCLYIPFSGNNSFQRKSLFFTYFDVFKNQINLNQQIFLYSYRSNILKGQYLILLNRRFLESVEFSVVALQNLPSTKRYGFPKNNLMLLKTSIK